MVSVYASNNEQLKFNKSYSANTAPVLEDISKYTSETETESPYMFMRYMKITIKGIKPSSFKFAVVSSKD